MNRTTDNIYRMFNDYPDVVTVNDMCHMLGIGKNKAYELVNNDTIGNIRIGRKHIIPKINVINFLLTQN